MAGILLRGERVTLRQWREADLAPFAALNDDPQVMRHLIARLSRAESDAFAQRIRTDIQTHGPGLWALDVPRLGFAGFVGLSASITGNRRSRAVMERIGLTACGEFDHPRLAEGHALRRHVLYARDAALTNLGATHA